MSPLLELSSRFSTLFSRSVIFSKRDLVSSWMDSRRLRILLKGFWVSAFSAAETGDRMRFVASRDVIVRVISFLFIISLLCVGWFLY